MSIDKILLAEMILQGIGVLIAWNAILTALDWYNDKFPTQNPGFWFPLLNFFPALVFQPLTILYGHHVRFNKRIIVSYIVVALILGLTPPIVELTNQDLGFIIICILTFIGGAFNAVGQTSVFGLASTLGSKYNSGVMLGNGLSGLSIALLRLICIETFPQDSSGYLESTSVYFGISGGVLVLCMFAQLHLMKNPHVIECISKTHSSEALKTLVPILKELGSFKVAVGYNNKNQEVKKAVDYKELLLAIWPYLFLMWINYFISFGVLSHVALATEASGMKYAIFTTLMILIFNFFDVLGRYTPNLFIADGLLLWVITLSRFGFWATFILIASDDPPVDPSWLFSATWFKFLNMAIYAFTNGFVTTCSGILAPGHSPDESKDKAGYIIVTGLMFGIFSGQLVSYAFINIGHVPEDSNN